VPNNPNNPGGSDVKNGPGGPKHGPDSHANNNHHHGGGGGGDGRDRLDEKELAQEYGMAYALFKHFPELMKLLKQAVAHSWTPSRFQAELHETDFWKNHSASYRTRIAEKYGDNKNYQQEIHNRVEKLRDLARANGAQFTAHALRRLAERAYLFDLSDADLMDVMANHVLPGESGHYGGQLSAIEEQLRGVAFRNGVRINDDQLKRWMRAIVRGDADVNQFETHLRDVAARTFAAFGDQIRGGTMDVMDAASPYIQSMASILELNPASIDLYDRTLRKALNNQNDKGEYVPMNISDFEDMLRQDKRWSRTKNARDEARGWTQAIAKAWGLA
jgi:hypothetical protein